MKHLLIAIVVSVSVLWSLSARSEQIDVSNENREPIGKYVHFLKEGTSPLSLDDAIKAYASGKFTASDDAFLNFGIGSKPVWLRFEIINQKKSSIPRRLSIETSWLDNIEVYFSRDGQMLESYHVGDSQPFSERPIKNHFFVFEHAFQPGKTTVYLRTETPDPMVLPIYLTSIEEAYSRQSLQSNTYGFLYGGIFTLLAYNLMLFFSLKSYRYLYYSIYLAFFLIMNASYTGHGFGWLWPNSPQWQLWSNPILMMMFAISGLLFATDFLNIKTFFPRLYRVVIYGSILFGTLQVLAVITGSHVSALLLSFFFIFLFSGSMVFLGVISLYAGNKSAKYFLFASIAHVSGSSVTAMAVWGIIPYSTLTYRAVDIGMMVDAILLAMALADQFRMTQEAKIQAERLAKIDPLTGINNRRAFYELVKPIWNTGLRNNRDMSVILIDIDKFKFINDTYGHAQGDNALILLAKNLMNEARSGDILARWGGEEFILFLPDTRLAEAISIAERFSQKISNMRLREENGTISLTASMGVVHNDKSDISLDDLISSADKHLYTAKEQGRDRVCSGHI